MDEIRYLIVGAGVSGLSFAAALEVDDYLICEGELEAGGYCRTVKQDGFTWDYSGHFFHFRNKDIEQHLVSRMSGTVRTIAKDSRILYRGRYIDFPFQKNIHQLEKGELLECLYDLYFRDERNAESFYDMLYAKFGRGIAEKFLIPYNEKLYAIDLKKLDVDAMGRFFPYADLSDVIRNFREGNNQSYNATFTYPEGGAIQYVEALLTDVHRERISLGERVESIDLDRKVARTSRREIRFEYLVSSAPFDRLLDAASVAYDRSVYTYNKVEIFNLGFDRKGPTGVHWIYVPDKAISFYRVGFYDNIFGADRMSLYIEIGHPRDAAIESSSVTATLERVIADLTKLGIVDGHALVSHHHVVLSPAYVHITKASQRDVAEKKKLLASRGVHSIGRYGSWTYCSIEDNMIEARELAATFNAMERALRPT